MLQKIKCLLGFHVYEITHQDDIYDELCNKCKHCKYKVFSDLLNPKIIYYKGKKEYRGL